MKRLSLILWLVFLSFVAIAQQEINNPSFDFGQKLNTLNVNGQREGLWIEDTWPGCIGYISYHNGERNGLSFTHQEETNTLSWIAYYMMGDLKVAIDFSDGGVGVRSYPLGTVLRIDYGSINTEFSIRKSDGSFYVPYFKAYCRGYYPDGRVKSEGFIVWDKGESQEIDFKECGVWKNYDLEQGITLKKYSDEPASIQNQNKKSDALFDFGQEINHFNAEGQKEGLWVENALPGCVSYITYQNGKRNGLSFMRHLPTNTISWIEYSENGELKALIQLSDGTEKSHLYPAGTVLSIHFGSINSEFDIEKDDGTNYRPYYKAYSKYFYPDRRVKSEGFLVWDKGESLQKESKECGEWKRFDKNGNPL